MVLADAKDVEADLIRQLDLLDQVAQPLRGIHTRSNVRKSVKAKLHRGFLSIRVRPRPFYTIYEIYIMDYLRAWTRLDPRLLDLPGRPTGFSGRSCHPP